MGLNAQTGDPCGTSKEVAEPIFERLRKNKLKVESGLIDFRDDIQYIPVKFHIARKSDGTGGVPESDILDQFCSLNKDFEDFDIQFFIDGDFNYIDNDRVYNEHRATEDGLMSLNREANALNIFMVNLIEGTVGGYYTPFKDWIVMRNSNVSGSTIPQIFAHEIGHYFSLQHTHIGWDDDPWNMDDHGCPTSAVAPDPVNGATVSGSIVEKVDGSNCEIAGDEICDTPPDYNGLRWRDCDYTGGACDPDGTEIDPMENNIMSYFFGCPRTSYMFTEMQQDIIKADLTNFDRQGLKTKSPRLVDEITSMANPVSPINGESAGPFDNVTLRWEEVANANAYLVVVSPFPNFPPNNSFVQITSTPSAVFTELDNNRLYYWRVKPFNDYYTCQQFSNFTTFRTSSTTSTNTISQVSRWQITPNPIYTPTFTIKFSTTDAISGNLRILSLAGNEVQNLGIVKYGKGSHELNVLADNLNAGVYFVNLNTGSGQISEKIVVLK